MGRKVIVGTILAIGILFSSGAAQEQTVAGDWLAVYTGPGGQSQKFYLTLKQDGDHVTGTYMNPSAKPPVPDRSVSGSFKDGTLVLGQIRATVTGDTMIGTMPVRTGQGVTFSGTRSK